MKYIYSEQHCHLRTIVCIFIHKTYKSNIKVMEPHKTCRATNNALTKTIQSAHVVDSLIVSISNYKKLRNAWCIHVWTAGDCTNKLNWRQVDISDILNSLEKIEYS